jgi:catechol 2,3-dioxygenase-like lactoylglutathione lyase family enzyme
MPHPANPAACGPQQPGLPSPGGAVPGRDRNTIVVPEYDPAVRFFVDVLGFDLVGSGWASIPEATLGDVVGVDCREDRSEQRHVRRPVAPAGCARSAPGRYACHLRHSSEGSDHGHDEDPARHTA